MGMLSLAHLSSNLNLKKKKENFLRYICYNLQDALAREKKILIQSNNCLFAYPRFIFFKYSYGTI